MLSTGVLQGRWTPPAFLSSYTVSGQRNWNLANKWKLTDTGTLFKSLIKSRENVLGFCPFLCLSSHCQGKEYEITKPRPRLAMPEVTTCWNGPLLSNQNFTSEFPTSHSVSFRLVYKCIPFFCVHLLPMILYISIIDRKIYNLGRLSESELYTSWSCGQVAEESKNQGLFPRTRKQWK
jgi:hypothetical protein